MGTIKCMPAVCKQLYTAQRCNKNLPALWQQIRRLPLLEQMCLHAWKASEWGALAGVNIAVGLGACVQNNYMLHCCEKMGWDSKHRCSFSLRSPQHWGGKKKNPISSSVSPSCRLWKSSLEIVQVEKVEDTRNKRFSLVLLICSVWSIPLVF